MEQLVHFKWSQQLIEYNTHSKEKHEHFVVSLLSLVTQKKPPIDSIFHRVSFETQKFIFPF